MDKIGEYKEKIINILKDLERLVAFSNKGGRFDLNKDAEEFYRGLLNLFFGWNLKSLNTEREPNHEGVDLGDIELGIAVQVTSENNPDKVRDSIKGFKHKSLKEGYRTLYILMFRGKQDFPRVDFAKTVDGSFDFNKYKHIIDHEDLCKKLKDAEFEYLSKIYSYLDSMTKTSCSDVDNNIDDLGIISEIFDFIQSNKPKKTTDFSTIVDLSEIALKPKIKLNFQKEQKDEIDRLINKIWDKKEIVGKFIKEQYCEDEVSINELIFTIQDDFCKLSGSKKPDTKIQDISVIKNLAMNYLPETKRKNIGYIANAEALVLYFFEFCCIGQKTEFKEEKKQLSLFN
ncbi:MAG: SMEK domain-containing protein [Candidatus Electronema sp. V4]|uniref:SMEK domain-containing protein n=1 Tax=Candidatus Electronema sp. V4 TaxID=3454756 RepID=UPI004055446A